jgi:anhydro-N-acetylmuramic acid kinase
MRVAGVMSGTSLDGIDVAIVEIAGRGVTTIGCTTTPYPERVRAAILAVSNCATTTAAISGLNFELAERYAAAVQRAVARFGPVSLIGCHGQTIYHQGGRNTLQIGAGQVLAERTGVPVVSNFRVRDVAAGGQGAPLVPFADYLLFRHPTRARIALNIGGIANITLIPPGAAPTDVLAFDTGPGNMVIDALTREHTQGRQKFDRNGRIARQGHIQRELLDELLNDPYYTRRPPKSAGREQYGEEFLARVKQSGAALPDLIATLTALTAATIARGVGCVWKRDCDLIVSGGGAHNARLLEHVAAFLPSAALSLSTDHGIDADAKEAIAFAILARETWRKRPANLPSATGARHPVILGEVAF